MPKRRAAKNHHGRPSEHPDRGDPLADYTRYVERLTTRLADGRDRVAIGVSGDVRCGDYLVTVRKWRSGKWVRVPFPPDRIVSTKSKAYTLRDLSVAAYERRGWQQVADRRSEHNPPRASVPKGIVTLRADKRVREIDDERDTENGWWLYLRRGWCDDADAHVIHADTVAGLTEHFTFITPCDCETCST